MNELTRPRGGGKLQTFDPREAKATIETLKAAVDYASRMQEWDAGMEAAEIMVEWQCKFVAWWDANVRVRQAAGGNRYKTNAGLRSSISRKAAAKAKYRNGLSES